MTYSYISFLSGPSQNEHLLFRTLNNLQIFKNKYKYTVCVYFIFKSLTSLAEERIRIFLLVAQAGHYLGSLSKSKFKNISKQAEKDFFLI